MRRLRRNQKLPARPNPNSRCADSAFFGGANCPTEADCLILEQAKAKRWPQRMVVRVSRDSLSAIEELGRNSPNSMRNTNQRKPLNGNHLRIEQQTGIALAITLTQPRSGHRKRDEIVSSVAVSVSENAGRDGWFDQRRGRNTAFHNEGDLL